jgi:hypothetical protein
MNRIHIDSHGQRHTRRIVSIIQKQHGRDAAISAAEAKWARRQAKRAKAAH